MFILFRPTYLLATYSPTLICPFMQSKDVRAQVREMRCVWNTEVALLFHSSYPPPSHAQSGYTWPSQTLTDLAQKRWINLTLTSINDQLCVSDVIITQFALINRFSALFLSHFRSPLSFCNDKRSRKGREERKESRDRATLTFRSSPVRMHIIDLLIRYAIPLSCLPKKFWYINIYIVYSTQILLCSWRFISKISILFLSKLIFYQ